MSEHSTDYVDLRDRVTRQEARLDSFASRDWVYQLVEPVSRAAIKTEESVTHLASQFDALFAAHDKLLQERAEREREEHAVKLAHAREGTFLNLVKEKWAPMIGFMLALAAFFATLGGAVAWWITHFVVPATIR